MSVQLGVDRSLLRSYEKRQQTVSEHQQRLIAYLGLRSFGEAETEPLERFLFEEACRLEQPGALIARTREFLKEHAVLEPAEFRIARIVSEQRTRAREHIFERVASAVPAELSRTLDELLVVPSEEAVSGVQKIKANPSKPSVEGMLALLRKLSVIEKTGVLDVDLSWLNGNYQRALFHQVRKSTADRLRELGEARRHASLVCFLRQSYRDARRPDRGHVRQAAHPDRDACPERAGRADAAPAPDHSRLAFGAETLGRGHPRRLGRRSGAPLALV